MTRSNAGPAATWAPAFEVLVSSLVSSAEFRSFVALSGLDQSSKSSRLATSL